MVEKFASITPNRIRLAGCVGKELKTSVSIIPEKKYPFKIVNVTAKQGKNIRYKIEEFKKSKISEYVLTVENIKKETGRYFDIIHLKTDSKIQPEISIRVMGNIYAKPINKTDK